MRTHISGIGKQEQTQDVKAHSIPRLYKYEPNDMRDKKENTVIQAGVLYKDQEPHRVKTLFVKC